LAFLCLNASRWLTRVPPTTCYQIRRPSFLTRPSPIFKYAWAITPSSLSWVTGRLLSPSMVSVFSSGTPSTSLGLLCHSTVCTHISPNVVALSMARTRLVCLFVSRPSYSPLTLLPTVNSPTSLLAGAHRWRSFIMSNQDAHPPCTRPSWPLPHRHPVQPPMFLAPRLRLLRTIRKFLLWRFGINLSALHALITPTVTSSIYATPPEHHGSTIQQPHP
jgi:hypothetical protein